MSAPQRCESSRLGPALTQLLLSDSDKEYDVNIGHNRISLDDYRALGNVLANNHSNIVGMSLNYSTFEDGAIKSVADAFRSNTSVRSLQVGVAFWDLLVASLQQNSSIQKLHVNEIMNTSQLEEIIEGIYETNIESFHATGAYRVYANGKWCDRPVLIGDQATRQSLLSILQKNYRLKEIEISYAWRMEQFKVLTDLNRAGRSYLQEETWTTQRGVEVMANVKDSLDSIFFHLQGNPALCFSLSDDNNKSEEDDDNKMGGKRSKEDDDNSLSSTTSNMRKIE